MSFSTQDCKNFIADNAESHQLPKDNWKRTSKTKHADGWLRTFKHIKGHEIQILEDTSSSSLKWLSIENSHTLPSISPEKNDLKIESAFNTEEFNALPKNVQLFINTLRSLQGNDALSIDTFDVKYQKLWNMNAIDRQALNNQKDLPHIMMYKSKGCDDSWDTLWQKFDVSFDDEKVLKALAPYFWFCFVNDSRDENENPQMLIAPKGFFDNGRIPLVFDGSKLGNCPSVEFLSEIMESTLEFQIDSKEPLEKIIKSYDKMKSIGIDFSLELQKMQSYHFNFGLKHDFCNDKWVKKHLEKCDVVEEMKYNVYFQYGETEEERDFLKSFATLKEAKAYKKESVKQEGWDGDDPTYKSYAEQYKIVDVEKENKNKFKKTI